MRREELLENALICDKNIAYALPALSKDLEPVPEKLLRFVFDSGYKIYVSKPHDEMFFKKHGLPVFTFADGRKSTECSSVDSESRIVIFCEKEEEFSLAGGYSFSVPLHEIMHAIHESLGFPKLPPGKPLDWYAALNNLETFAVAGEAFCHPERFVSSDYWTHNREELKRRAPEHFAYFENLFREWS